jgi:integrase
MTCSVQIMTLVEEYLAARRAAGFALLHEEGQLRAFARFTELSDNHVPITAELALSWARSSRHGRQITAARRVEVLRPFLKYCFALGHAVEVVAPGVCGPPHRRLSPHIYTEGEIGDLLNAASGLGPKGGLRPITYVTLFGLLAATGMRLSEALSLEKKDVNLNGRLLTLRETKFRKSRLIPIHETTAAALANYEGARRRDAPTLGSPFYFATASGNRLPSRTVEHNFDQLRTQLGWQARGGHDNPRLQDLRHTFICRALLYGVQDSKPVDSLVDTISTYVGHAKVSDTYWYLSATPELMNAAANRFAKFAEGDAR